MDNTKKPRLHFKKTLDPFRVPMNRVELLSEAYESPVLTVELHRQVSLRYSISLDYIKYAAG